MSSFASTLQIALQAALDHLQSLDRGGVSATAGLEQLRARLRKPLNEESLPPEAVVEELVRDAKDGILGSAGGRFFAWVVGGALPAALAADWLTSTWDQNAGIYACGPSAAVVEEVVGEWLKDLLGLPQSASFALVTGCQMAHATCLASARHALLAQRGWDVERQGLCGAPLIRIFTSSEHHGSTQRAVQLLGMGSDQIQALPCNGSGRLSAAALEAALSGHQPVIVVLQAGDLNIGAYDDFETLIPLARRFGAWVHVDGAFGLWAQASSRYAHFLAGVSAADSWAADGHKWLNVPYDCGYAFVAHPEAHRGAMSHRASYLVHAEDARDQIDWNPEWSRRARGFASYAALRQLGRRGLSALIDRCCAHALALVQGIGALPGAEVLWLPRINQGLVGFQGDWRTDEVIAATIEEGSAFFWGTTWRGRRAMRVSVCNWQTTSADVDRAIAAVAWALRKLTERR
jgi:glutamate/tyrosine decarboxylase-like PLP-dependent enzyme